MTASPPGRATRVIDAPGKVNRGLRVLGRRDDGYHELRTTIVPISLVDELEVHAFAGPGMFRTLSLSLDVTGEPDATRGVPVDETNLVLHAARLLAEREGVRGFAEFTLRKRVPAAAGLGGGSSDAAAALLTLADLWDLAVDGDALRAIGADVGSDVPALLARRAVVIGGRGEHVEPLGRDDADVGELLLVTFDFGVATADAFRWWDEDGGPTAAGDDPWSNDLEAPVVARHRRVASVRDALLAAGARHVAMSGSGPSVVATVPPEGFDDEVLASLTASAGRRPVLVEPWTDRQAPAPPTPDG